MVNDKERDIKKQFESQFGERPKIPFQGKNVAEYYEEQQLIWDAKFTGWQAAIASLQNQEPIYQLWFSLDEGWRDVDKLKFDCTTTAEFKRIVYLAPPQSLAVQEALEKAAELVVASIASIGDIHSYNNTELDCCNYTAMRIVSNCEEIILGLIDPQPPKANHG